MWRQYVLILDRLNFYFFQSWLIIGARNKIWKVSDSSSMVGGIDYVNYLVRGDEVTGDGGVGSKQEQTLFEDLPHEDIVLNRTGK